MAASVRLQARAEIIVVASACLDRLNQDRFSVADLLVNILVRRYIGLLNNNFY